MSSSLQHLIDRNHAWAERVERENPGFFKDLSAQQSPKYLWIGCSDSRVPANQVIGLAPGEVFVHRNVANVVVHSDLNALSVIQFAVDVLKVEHIMVVGHYGCGGVLAVLHEKRVGLADNWLRHVHDVKMRHRKRIDHLPVAVDPSHGTGSRDLVIPMAGAAVAAGADMLLVEIHPSPSTAISDGAQTLDHDQFADMILRTAKIAEAVGRSLRSS